MVTGITNFLFLIKHYFSRKKRGDCILFILCITSYSLLSAFINFFAGNKNNLEIIEKKGIKKAEHKMLTRRVIDPQMS